jgi:hypothetical protein
VPQPGGSMYGAIAIRNRTVTPDEGTVELAKVGVGEGGAAAGLAILGSTTSVLSGRLNAATGWALIGGVLLP